MNGEVDGAVVTRRRGGRDPTGPVGRIVEIGQQTGRVTTVVLGRIAQRSVLAVGRRRAVFSPATSTNMPPPRSQSHFPRLSLSTDLTSAQP